MTSPPQRPSRAADSRLTPSAISEVAGELRLACMRISRRVRFESTHVVAPHQYSALCRLAEGPCTPSELAEIEKVSGPSMTRTVAALVEKGLVERAVDPADRRQVNLSLTPAARTLLKEIRRKRDAWMSVRVSHLEPQEQEILRQATAILTRVASE